MKLFNERLILCALLFPPNSWSAPKWAQLCGVFSLWCPRWLPTCEDRSSEMNRPGVSLEVLPVPVATPYSALKSGRATGNSSDWLKRNRWTTGGRMVWTHLCAAVRKHKHLETGFDRRLAASGLISSTTWVLSCCGWTHSCDVSRCQPSFTTNRSSNLRSSAHRLQTYRRLTVGASVSFGLSRDVSLVSRWRGNVSPGVKDEDEEWRKETAPDEKWHFSPGEEGRSHRDYPRSSEQVEEPDSPEC